MLRAARSPPLARITTLPTTTSLYRPSPLSHHSHKIGLKVATQELMSALQPPDNEACPSYSEWSFYSVVCVDVLVTCRRPTATPDPRFLCVFGERVDR